LLDAYPPALQSLVKSRKDFEQLEDFNARAKRAKEQEDKAKAKKERKEKKDKAKSNSKQEL
jgi:hypothetical protein